MLSSKISVCLTLLVVGGCLAAEGSAVADCKWRGTAPVCEGECGAGESEVMRAASDPGIFEETTGARLTFGSDCLTGSKSMCCKTRGTMCQWRGTAPFCAGQCQGGEVQQTPPPGSSSGNKCVTGSKVYCCTPPPAGIGMSAQRLSTCPIDRALCSGKCCAKGESCWEGSCGSVVKSIGRVKVPDQESDARMSICDRARHARARNSPAASNLEAQCRASTETVKSIGRVKVSDNTVESARPICDRAREARARNSPAAPGLEAQCQARLPRIPLAGAAPLRGQAPAVDESTVGR